MIKNIEKRVEKEDVTLTIVLQGEKIKTQAIEFYTYIMPEIKIEVDKKKTTIHCIDRAFKDYAFRIITTEERKGIIKKYSILRSEVVEMSLGKTVLKAKEIYFNRK